MFIGIFFQFHVKHMLSLVFKVFHMRAVQVVFQALFILPVLDLHVGDVLGVLWYLSVDLEINKARAFLNHYIFKGTLALILLTGICMFIISRFFINGILYFLSFRWNAAWTCSLPFKLKLWNWWNKRFLKESWRRIIFKLVWFSWLFTKLCWMYYKWVSPSRTYQVDSRCNRARLVIM